MLEFEDEDGKPNAISGLAVQPTSGFMPGAGGKEERFAAGNAFRRITVEDKRIINSKAGQLNAVPSDGGVPVVAGAEEAKFCAIDNPECEACQ